MNKREITIFPSVEKLAEFAADWLMEEIDEIPAGSFFTIALAGGSTPPNIFNYLSSFDKGRIDWSRIKLFWTDERCVSPDDEESNYKMARLNLIERINIPEENIFRIHGEEDPTEEAIRYSHVLKDNVPISKGFPRLDIVMLGLGKDGHTASLFPGNTRVFYSKNYCEAVIHPQTGQKRITITGPVINNARNVVFFVTGEDKANIAYKLLKSGFNSRFPASLVEPVEGKHIWMMDYKATKFFGCIPDLNVKYTSSLKTKNKTALVFGASGLTGSVLTDLLLKDERYSEVRIFTRTKPEKEHPKLRVIVNKLENMNELEEVIKGDDLFCCLGTTMKKAGSRPAFQKVDLDLPVEIAGIASKNEVSKFLVISSMGACKRSPAFYLRTKGKMEEAVMSFPFAQISIIRPSLLLGERKERRILEEIGGAIASFTSIFFIGPLKKYRPLSAVNVARAMIQLANMSGPPCFVKPDKIVELTLPDEEPYS